MQRETSRSAAHSSRSSKREERRRGSERERTHGSHARTETTRRSRNHERRASRHAAQDIYAPTYSQTTAQPSYSINHYGVQGYGGKSSLFQGNNIFRSNSIFDRFGRVGTIAAGVVLIFVIFQLIGCLARTVMPTTYIGGNGGITSSPLFQSSQTTFQADLLIPKIFSPRRPGMATIEGTRRVPGSAGDQLSQAIHTIESNGYKVGFALYDVNTGVTITYNANAAFYSASSIKGPYVVSLVKYELGSSASSESNRISNILMYSDNDSYSSLRDAYGNSCFASLVSASGANSLAATGATEDIQNAMAYQSGSNGTEISDNNYEFYSANQLLALWKECYSFLASDEPGATWLTEQFNSPEISAISASASTIGTTWSKAGWYPEETSGFGTTVDGGVVRTNTGDVVLCVLTNDPEDFATVESIVGPLLAARATLTN